MGFIADLAEGGDDADSSSEPEQDVDEISLHGMEGPFKIFIHDLNLASVGFLEFSSLNAEGGAELTIIEDPDLTTFDHGTKDEQIDTAKLMDELKSSSPTSVFTHADGIQENLSGTIFYTGVLLLRLGRLLSRENHFDVYSLDCPSLSKFLEGTSFTFRVRVYTFIGISPRVAKFRRRNMKRMLTYHGAIRAIHHDERIYLSYMTRTILLKDSTNANVSSPKQEEANSGSTDIESFNRQNTQLELKKAKARVKQRERRQRNREKKRGDTSEYINRSIDRNAESPVKRYVPFPDDISMKFLLGVYDIDHPHINPIEATG